MIRYLSICLWATTFYYYSRCSSCALTAASQELKTGGSTNVRVHRPVTVEQGIWGKVRASSTGREDKIRQFLQRGTPSSSSFGCPPIRFTSSHLRVCLSPAVNKATSTISPRVHSYTAFYLKFTITTAYHSRTTCLLLLL